MKKDNDNQRHEHSGRSSAEFLDAADILERVGLEEGQVVLDVGSGSGYFSLAAVPYVGMGGKIFALDADEKAILTLKRTIEERNIPNLQALSEDVARHISIPKNSIDICLMVNVLHGFVVNQEVDDVFRVLDPVLKEGARLVIIDFKKNLTTPGPPQRMRLSPEDIGFLLKRHRFESGRIFNAGPFHFGQILKKKNKTDRE